MNDFARTAVQNPAKASHDAVGHMTDIAADRLPSQRERRHAKRTMESQIDNVIDRIHEAIRHTPGLYPENHAESIPPDQSDSLADVGLDLGLRAQVVYSLLLGEAGRSDRCTDAGLVGIDVDSSYVTFRARTRPGHQVEELAAELRLCAPSGEVLAAELDGDLIGLLPTAPEAVTSGMVGLGPAAAPDRLVESFSLASRAMDAAIAFGLTGVHAFGDLGLLPTIVADTEVGEALWMRYVRPLDEVGWGAEILSAIRTWFGCGMHVDRAAAQLTVHSNTIRNRIARFEDLAGVDLRNAAAAMQVWWALHYGALAGAGSLRSTMDADSS